MDPIKLQQNIPPLPQAPATPNVTETQPVSSIPPSKTRPNRSTAIIILVLGALALISLAYVATVKILGIRNMLITNNQTTSVK